jgi:hypothetical protein
MFNLAFVFDKDAETSSYEPVVRKMARVLKALEKENEFLSRQTRIAMMDPGALANPLYIQSAPATPAFTSSSMMAIQAARPPIFGTTTSTETAQANGGNNGNANLETIAEAASALSLNETNTSNASAASGAPSASDTLATGTITSTGLVSSPPSTVGSTPVLIAPASSSPFPLSKSSSTSSSNTFTNSTNGTSSAPSSHKGTPSMLFLQGQPDENGMQNLIEQLLEDLNSYCECRIPIGKLSSMYHHHGVEGWKSETVPLTYTWIH